jgi:mutator protein MutT
VVGGVILIEHRVLLGHRDPSRAYYPDCWDVPGGHIEPGESEQDALQRELREELGINVDLGTRAVDFRLLGDDYDLMLWVVREWRGEIANNAPNEHTQLRWFTAGELRGLRLADTRYVELLAASISRYGSA